MVRFAHRYGCQPMNYRVANPDLRDTLSRMARVLFCQKVQTALAACS